jgi:peptidyl-prolyl cis-trans isomerase B (cyclophilin B)
MKRGLNKMKKYLYMVLFILLFIGVLTMAGCNNRENEPRNNDPFRTSGETARPVPTPGQPPTPNHHPTPEEVLARPPVVLQLTPLTPGEELVVLHTNHGDITLRLFPQAAPIAVENFLTHAANGYYDGLIFHRVMENFMIQGGCSEGTGMAGQSIWGTSFGPEHNYDLWHFNGALAMAQSGLPNSIGSQFYIVHRSDLDAAHTHEFNLILESYMDSIVWQDPNVTDGPYLTFGDIYLREMLEHYLKVGGTPHLDFPFKGQGPNYGHTVFGHVVEGMEVVNSIAATPVGSGSRPLEDVVIERVSIIVYQG